MELKVFVQFVLGPIHYGITDAIRLAPSVNYFLIKEASILDFNFDGNYVIGSSDKFAPFAIAGLNYFSSEGESWLRFNIGAGLQTPIGKNLMIVFEAKYVLGQAEFDQPFGTIGFLFSL
jgi:hypothetical protein